MRIHCIKYHWYSFIPWKKQAGQTGIRPKRTALYPRHSIFSLLSQHKNKIKTTNIPQWGTENAPTASLSNISVHSVSFQLIFVYHFVSNFGNGQDDLLGFVS